MAVSATATTIKAGQNGLVAVLLAGGRGTRLGALTANESKPAVPFLGDLRIVDFVMANALASGITSMTVCTQWAPTGLVNHLQAHWSTEFRDGLTFRFGPDVAGPLGFEGTAHAVASLADELDAAGVQDVLVLSADQVYQMDYRDLVGSHRATGKPMTVASLPVPLSVASGFGVFDVEGACHAKLFVEKPSNPPRMAEMPDRALASMGIYVTRWPWLRRVLQEKPKPMDFGHDILPKAVDAGEVGVYCFSHPNPAITPYWRDVGTVDALESARRDFETAQRPFSLPVLPQKMMVHP
jgi:glucose-1-phosphate adenylyltransferase